VGGLITIGTYGTLGPLPSGDGTAEGSGNVFGRSAAKSNKVKPPNVTKSATAVAAIPTLARRW
jgi:hypothetical protein